MTKPKAPGDKKPQGRPPSYRAEYVEQAAKLTALGAIDIDIADFFKVDVRTIYRWKHTHPAFSQALTRAKEAADQIVEERLFRRATGYSQAAVKIFMPAGAKQPVFAHYTEHVPPDTTAAIFWLKNRQPDKWREPGAGAPPPSGAGGSPAEEAAREIRDALREMERRTDSAADAALGGAAPAPDPEPVLEQPAPVQHGPGGPSQR